MKSIFRPNFQFYDSGEDEQNCNFGLNHCSEHEFECVHSLGCIPLSKVCDGFKDCEDRSDEWGCLNKLEPIKPIKCLVFTCQSSDCLQFGASDGQNCSQTFYSITDLRVDYKSVTPTSFTILWETPSSLKNFQYMPSYSRINAKERVNKTWIKDEIYTFDGLMPGSTYNVSVYSKPINESQVYPPLHFITVTTESIGLLF
jgi:hypothetical protein